MRIDVTNLSKIIRGSVILDNISIHFESGHIYGMENQKLLVLDEPFNALDEKSVKLFRELLIEYQKQEKLIILTSHNKEDIESLCDHTYQIQSGQIIAE